MVLNKTSGSLRTRTTTVVWHMESVKMCGDTNLAYQPTAGGYADIDGIALAEHSTWIRAERLCRCILCHVFRLRKFQKGRLPWFIVSLIGLGLYKMAGCIECQVQFGKLYLDVAFLLALCIQQARQRGGCLAFQCFLGLGPGLEWEPVVMNPYLAR